MKKNIAIVNYHLEYKYTGEYSHLIKLKEILSEKYETELLIPDGIQKKLEQKNSTEKFGFKAKNILGIRKLLKQIDGKYSIIHLILPTPIFNILLIGLTFKSKLIVQFESNLWDISFKILLHGLKYDFVFFLTRVFLSNKYIAGFFGANADYYLVSTEYQKNELLNLNYPENKIKILPSLFIEPEKTNKSGEELKKLSDIKNNGVYLTYIGHFFAVKGIFFLINSLADLLKKRNMKLILAYSGLGDIYKIIKLIQRLDLTRHIIIIEKINVIELMNLSDILIFPYLTSMGTTLYPAVVMEVFSTKKKVLLPDLQIYKHFPEYNKNVYLYRNFDAKDFIIKVIYLLENKISNEDISNNIFDLKINIEGYLNLYNEFN
ncbi:MAG TPA: glycosyltransferase [bacterium]|nr:glycosyltransferase [bacterium]